MMKELRKCINNYNFVFIYLCKTARPGEKEELLKWAMVILPLVGMSIDLEFILVVEALGQNLINSMSMGQRGSRCIWVGASGKRETNQAYRWILAKEDSVYSL